MITMTVTEFAKKLKKVFDLIEYKGEEIVLVRNKHRIARILPGSPHLTATEAMSDLFRTLPDEAAVDWEEESKQHGTIEEVRDPWES